MTHILRPQASAHSRNSLSRTFIASSRRNPRQHRQDISTYHLPSRWPERPHAAALPSDLTRATYVSPLGGSLSDSGRRWTDLANISSGKLENRAPCCPREALQDQGSLEQAHRFRPRDRQGGFWVCRPAPPPSIDTSNGQILTVFSSSLAPYERRVIELLRNSKDKRARKLAKKRLGTFGRAKAKVDELQGVIAESRRTAAH